MTKIINKLSEELLVIFLSFNQLFKLCSLRLVRLSVNQHQQTLVISSLCSLSAVSQLIRSSLKTHFKAETFHLEMREMLKDVYSQRSTTEMWSSNWGYFGRHSAPGWFTVSWWFSRLQDFGVWDKRSLCCRSLRWGWKGVKPAVWICNPHFWWGAAMKCFLYVCDIQSQERNFPVPNYSLKWRWGSRTVPGQRPLSAGWFWVVQHQFLSTGESTLLAVLKQESSALIWLVVRGTGPTELALYVSVGWIREAGPQGAARRVWVWVFLAHNGRKCCHTINGRWNSGKTQSARPLCHQPTGFMCSSTLSFPTSKLW